jgi:hypothetical protein
MHNACEFICFVLKSPIRSQPKLCILISIICISQCSRVRKFWGRFDPQNNFLLQSEISAPVQSTEIYKQNGTLLWTCNWNVIFFRISKEVFRNFNSKPNYSQGSCLKIGQHDLFTCLSAQRSWTWSSFDEKLRKETPLNNFELKRKLSRNSVVDIATHYGLDGPKSNPGGGKIFHTRPDRFWGPHILLYNGCRVFLRG